MVGLEVQEERRLVERVRQGDRQALDRMFLGHLGLVAEVLEEQDSQGRETLELLEQGNLALLRAIMAFHSSGQPDFQAYARSCIRSALGSPAHISVRGPG